MGMDSLLCDSNVLQSAGFVLGYHQPRYAGISLFLDRTSPC